jgi:hypothetical protein
VSAIIVMSITLAEFKIWPTKQSTERQNINLSVLEGGMVRNKAGFLAHPTAADDYRPVPMVEEWTMFIASRERLRSERVSWPTAGPP